MGYDSVDVAASETPGWYGKLAPLGDFADRRLPREFVACADAWLSRAMSASRAQLGDGWLERYLSAPLLRFAWAPGVFDSAWWFGVLMPSCDNVGRYFPLLVASRRLQPPQTSGAFDHLDAWFDHLATAATETLAEGASVESFEHALGVAPRWPLAGASVTGVSGYGAAAAAAAATGASPVASQKGANSPPGGASASVRHWLHGMAIATLQARFAGCSIWWHPADDGIDAAASVVSGLPESAVFAAMLSTR